MSWMINRLKEIINVKEIVMKKILLIMLSSLLFAPIGCSASDDRNNLPGEENQGESPEVTNDKILIVFFSRTGENYPNNTVINVGRTAVMAQYIKEFTGGTLYEIVPETPYPDSYSETLAISQAEIDRDARPAIKTPLENLQNYSTVFVGCPIWYGRPPMIMHTFYEAYPELANKTIIPFGTHEGSGINSCTNLIRQYFPDATMLESYGVRGQDINTAKNNVEAWLRRINIPEKK